MEVYFREVVRRRHTAFILIKVIQEQLSRQLQQSIEGASGAARLRMKEFTPFVHEGWKMPKAVLQDFGAVSGCLPAQECNIPRQSGYRREPGSERITHGKKLGRQNQTTIIDPSI